MKSFFCILTIIFCTEIFSLPHIVIMGPPGAGKGTLAHGLSSRYPFESICAGDLLREEIHKKSEIGLKIADTVKNGEMVENTILFSLLQSRLANAMLSGKALILDGFVQSKDNILFLEEIIDKMGLSDQFIYIHLSADYNTVLYRLSNRLICPKCCFSEIKAESSDSQYCPKCNLQLLARIDDIPAVIGKRLNRYYHQVEPLIEYYKEKPGYHLIDSVQSKETLLNFVEEVITSCPY